jgi:hypothetical protein
MHARPETPPILVATFALLALGGCTVAPNPIARPPTPEEPATTRVTRKEVADKEPPATLRARDGSGCRVSADRYARTEIGDHVVCVWSTGRDPD